MSLRLKWKLLYAFDVLLIVCHVLMVQIQVGYMGSKTEPASQRNLPKSDISLPDRHSLDICILAECLCLPNPFVTWTDLS